MRLKSILLNTLLAVCAFAVFYVPVELVWRNALMAFPVILHEQLGRLAPLAQVGKKDVVPEDYILIIGDSYVEGLGDWFMQRVKDGNPVYNAGHVLHELSGEDVLSFGYRGGYPSYTIPFQTTKDFGGLNKYAGFDIQPPKRVLAFFFEGNDFADELAALHRGGLTLSQISDAAIVDEMTSNAAQNGEAAASKRWNVFRNAHLIDTASKLSKLVYKNMTGRGIAPFAPDDRWIRSYTSRDAYVENWDRYEASNVFVDIGGTTGKYPDETVEPIAFHTDEEIGAVATVFEASLRYLKTLFPDAEFWAVYVPSPMNAYEFESDQISLADLHHDDMNKVRSGPKIFDVMDIHRRSDEACTVIRKASLQAGATFVDTRPALRQISARDGYLHGPNDAGHFNERGYRALANILHNAIQGELEAPCAIAGNT